MIASIAQRKRRSARDERSESRLRTRDDRARPLAGAHPGLAPETTPVLTIRRENGSEPDTRDPRARSHSDRACPGVRRTFVPRFGMAFGLICPGRRRHLACRSHRLVDRVEGLGLSDGAPSGTWGKILRLPINQEV